MNTNRSPIPMFNSVNPTPSSVVTPNLIRNGLLIVLLILLVVGVSLAIYYRQIINDYFYPPAPPPPSPPPPEENSVPPPPQPVNPAAAAMVEMVLPERRQVFNISENRYTFYDAEPLCKALGAELATYDQVKEAYGNGGDWCNYGWSVGQMALYPTQEETWKKLQSGPEGQRMSCGTVGVNGGFFDNPELRFGVNCYGTKPVQKNHDASVVSNNDSYPQSPETIEFDKKVSKFKSISDTIGILPFKKNTWSA